MSKKKRINSSSVNVSSAVEKDAAEQSESLVDHWRDAIILVRAGELIDLRSGDRIPWAGYLDFAATENSELAIRHIRIFE